LGKGEDGSKRLHYSKVATFGGLNGKIWGGEGGMKMSSTYNTIEDKTWQT